MILTIWNQKTYFQYKIQSDTVYIKEVDCFFKKDGEKNLLLQDDKIIGNLEEASNNHVKIFDANYCLKIQKEENIQERKYYKENRKIFSVGGSPQNTIRLNNIEGTILVFFQENHEYFLKKENQEALIFLNKNLLQDGSVIQNGDVIYDPISDIEVRVQENIISIVSENKNISSDFVEMGDLKYELEDFPNYQRAPRMFQKIPDDKIKITHPTSITNKNNEGLWKIIMAPIIMLAGTIVMSFLMPRGPYVIILAATTVATTIGSITTYFKKKKSDKEELEQRSSSYNYYLIEKSKELNRCEEEERFAMNYSYPRITEVEKIAKDFNSRIYERTIFHHDFLVSKIGYGNIKPHFSVDFENKEIQIKRDPLVEEASRLAEKYGSLTDMPMTINLLEGALGIIGKRNIVIEQVQRMISELSVFHSYHDLQFIVICPEEEKCYWDCLRFLPHLGLGALNTRGLVYNQRTRDQVLNSFYQIAKGRKNQLTKSSVKIKMQPQYIVILSNEKLVTDHAIMEFFEKDPIELGISLVYLENVVESLPEYIKNIIDYYNDNEGLLVLQDQKLVNMPFKTDKIQEGFEKEMIPRSLAALNHVQSLAKGIPETVGFLEMFGVEKIEDLEINVRYRNNSSHRSLATPLGFRGKEDIVYLDLHEKAHGPHGLVAGTTGSGKSEIIQSYILSLAVNFHPHEVAFLLIDYKGGGMANLFKELPHLVGVITNLDKNQSMRALISIKAELERRQKLFSNNNVNHINQYQKIFKDGADVEPMPHLFIIADEFAELKKEQPEFMKELVSTARIGRSLGIHLVLATQKPSGVVDDQIWSNSKFKLALKVQDVRDSNEILKTADAADITLPGRAYLQVGNNEIYELFQSAWSGRVFKNENSEKAEIDETIYSINSLGQYEILSKDLSGIGEKTNFAKEHTELEAVVDHLSEYVDKNKISMVNKPWLPPLGENIVLDDIEENSDENLWDEGKKKLEILVGISDEPEKQEQNILKINLTKEGHAAVFGSSGFGKTNILQTMAISLFRKHSPKNLHVYLMDFGNNGLLSLKGFPHVGDYISLEEEEKCLKLFKIIEQEINNRKKLCKEYGVGFLEMYEQISGEEMPHIVLFLDNYDGLKDTGIISAFERFLSKVLREGGSLGVHFILTASRYSSIKYTLSANIKIQATFFAIDKMDINNVVGRTDIQLEAIPGRGLIKLDQVLLFQAPLPQRGNEVLDRLEAIGLEKASMTDRYIGELPPSVPMVPDVILIADFIKRADVQEILAKGSEIPLGLSLENVKPIVVDFAYSGNLLVSGRGYDEIKRIMAGLLKLVMSKKSDKLVYVWDSNLMDFFAKKDEFSFYGSTPKEILASLAEIIELNEVRENDFITAYKESGGKLKNSEFYEAYPNVYVFVPNIGILNNLPATDNKKLGELIKNGGRTKIHFIVGSDTGYLLKNYDEATKIIKVINTTILDGNILDQGVFSINNRRDFSVDEIMKKNEVYVIKDGVAEKMKFITN